VFPSEHCNRKRACSTRPRLDRARLHDRRHRVSVEKGEDAWSAGDAVARFLEADVDPTRITVSSDGGGCLPNFDAHGRVNQWGVGSPESSPQTWTSSEPRLPLDDVLPPFTSNVADLLRLQGKSASNRRDA